MPEERRVVIDRTQKDTGWVLFNPSPDEHSIIEVREMLPLVQDGNTVGIHVWFD